MIINLTPHNINIGTRVIEPSGEVARVSTNEQVVGEKEGIPLLAVTYGEVTGLPQPQEGVVLIVSGMVRSAAPDRLDLASPGRPVRDADGRIVGCGGLIVR